MAGRDDERHPPSDDAAVPVPQLIEKYRAQREAWMAQADELARLRDEVRGSAEREALDIVASARRDIREIVMNARRELFVLSAQVHAALGESVPPTPIGPAAIAHDDERGSAEDDLARFAEEEWGFAPRSTVAAVLEEARRDIDVLDQDARTVPTQTVLPVPPPPQAASPVPVEGAAAALDRAPLSAAPPFDVAPPPDAATDWKRNRLLAAAAAALVIVVVSTVLMLQGGAGEPSDAPANGEASLPSAASPAQPVDPPAPVATQPPTAITLSLEAVRPAWIRAIVDGRPDAGQMLSAGETQAFTGRTIDLRIGDAGAVRVSVNGAEAATLGRDGQVVNREYTLEPPAVPGNPAARPAPPEPPEPREGSGQADPNAGAAAASAAPAEPLPAESAPLISPAATPAPVADAGSRPAASASGPTLERTSTSAPSAEPALVASARRWLDAYHRQDEVALSVLSTPDVAVVDERPTSERMPIAVGAIARTLDRVNVQVAADTAILTGVMTERAVDGGLQRSSPVSLVWVANGESWRLSQARLVSQSALGQLFR